MTFSYYYIDKQNQQQGPITADRFAEFGIRPDTLVWREGMRSWMAAISLNELQPLFRGENFNGQTTGYNSMSDGYNNGYQQPLPNYQVPPMPPRPIGHIILTAISAFLCFGTIILLPFPIIGFIKCLEAEKKYNIGLYAEAIEAAQKARKWSLIGIGVFTALFLLIIILYFVLISTMLSSSVFSSYTNL